MGRKPTEMIGKRFGNWTVLGFSKERTKKGRIRYYCRCDCGTERDVEGQTLRSGQSKSCGCRENNISLYTVYRNKDDKIVAFDATAKEAAKAMGIQQQSLYHLFCVRGGKNLRYTVCRSKKDDIDDDDLLD